MEPCDDGGWLKRADVLAALAAARQGDAAATPDPEHMTCAVCGKAIDLKTAAVSEVCTGQCYECRHPAEPDGPDRQGEPGRGTACECGHPKSSHSPEGGGSSWDRCKHCRCTKCRLPDAPPAAPTTPATGETTRTEDEG
jgi:hypothetical protein